MLILAASEDDYFEIVNVWEDSVRATHNFLSEKDIQFLKPVILNKYLPATKVYLLKNSKSRILGFTGVADNNIEMLFIRPDHFGRGLGRKLAFYAIRELGAVKVDVNEQNPSAIGFYQHIGFKIVSRSEFDGEGKSFPILHMELL